MSVTQLDAPTGLTSSNVTPNRFTITWTAVNNASEYDVTITDGTTTTTESSTDTTENFTSLVAGTEYTVSIVATNDGNRAYSDSEAATLTVMTSALPTLSYPTVPPLTVDTTVVELSPTVTNFVGTITYEISVQGGTTLIPGITLDRATGVISGTPTSVGSETVRTIVASFRKRDLQSTTSVDLPRSESDPTSCTHQHTSSGDTNPQPDSSHMGCGRGLGGLCRGRR